MIKSQEFGSTRDQIWVYAFLLCFRAEVDVGGVHELPELLHCEISLSLFAPGMPILAIELCNRRENGFAGRHGCYGE